MGPNGFIRQSVSNSGLSRVDLDVNNDTDIWSTSVSLNGGYLYVSGQTILGQVSFNQNISVRPAGFAGVATPPINLYVYEYGGGVDNAPIRQAQTFRGSAKSISELRAKYPEKFRQYFIPLLSKISDMSWLRPGATDVYSVFTEIPADPQVTARLQTLLPELDSDAFHIRDAASAQLLEMGPAGVLAALRTNLADLSDEQRAQLGRLIAAHRRRAEVALADARVDTAFLADCLEHDDVAVRQAAKSALGKVLGESVSFDPALSGTELGMAADGVRKKIAQMHAATTQPAEGEAAKEKELVPAVAPNGIRPRIMIR
jgi:hypothetical protein